MWHRQGGNPTWPTVCGSSPIKRLGFWTICGNEAPVPSPHLHRGGRSAATTPSTTGLTSPPKTRGSSLLLRSGTFAYKVTGRCFRIIGFAIGGDFAFHLWEWCRNGIDVSVHISSLPLCYCLLRTVYCIHSCLLRYRYTPQSRMVAMVRYLLP
jgi:hypothetical protein